MRSVRHRASPSITEDTPEACPRQPPAQSAEAPPARHAELDGAGHDALAGAWHNCQGLGRRSAAVSTPTVPREQLFGDAGSQPSHRHLAPPGQRDQPPDVERKQRGHERTQIDLDRRLAHRRDALPRRRNACAVRAQCRGDLTPRARRHALLKQRPQYSPPHRLHTIANTAAALQQQSTRSI